jgi:hypothetical protein
VPPLLPWQEIAFATAISTLVFGMGVAMIYLYIANVSTRQTLHDLFAGTFVVKRDGGVVENRTHRVHLVIVGVWLLLFVAGIPLAWPLIKNFDASKLFGGDFKTLTAVYHAVNAEPGVLSAQVTQNTNTFWNSGKKETTTSLQVTVTIDHAVDDAEAKSVAKVIAQRVLAVTPDIIDREKLSVTVRYGYDIGVWSRWNAFNSIDTPADWKTALAPKPTVAKKAK